jgi:hypothetical protein
MLSFLIEKCETEGETATAQTGLSADQLAKVVAGNAYAAGSDTVRKRCSFNDIFYQSSL